MKSAKQWLDENDPAWADDHGKPELTENVIRDIQADALEHAAKCADYVAAHAAQDSPNTGDSMEGGEDVARGAQIAAVRIRLAAHDVKPII